MLQPLRVEHSLASVLQRLQHRRRSDQAINLLFFRQRNPLITADDVASDRLGFWEANVRN